MGSNNGRFDSNNYGIDTSKSYVQVKSIFVKALLKMKQNEENRR